MGENRTCSRFDRIAESAADGDHRMFADATGAERAVDLRSFNRDAVDFFRNIETGRNLVIGERRLQQLALVVVELAFAPGGAKTLDHAADCLTAH